jgi:hypothetical protein
VEKILNMRKDGRTGWTLCDHCKSYNNILHMLNSPADAARFAPVAGFTPQIVEPQTRFSVVQCPWHGGLVVPCPLSCSESFLFFFFLKEAGLGTGCQYTFFFFLKEAGLGTGSLTFTVSSLRVGAAPGGLIAGCGAAS